MGLTHSTSKLLQPSQAVGQSLPATDTPTPSASRRPLKRETTPQRMGLVEPTGNFRNGEQSSRLKRTAAVAALVAAAIAAAFAATQSEPKTTRPDATKNALILPHGASPITLPDAKANKELTCLRELAAKAATTWVEENCDPQLIQATEDTKNPVALVTARRKELLKENGRDGNSETWVHDDESGEPEFIITVNPSPLDPVQTAKHSD